MSDTDTTMVVVKKILDQKKTKQKFTEVLGQKAPQFMASVANTVQGNAQLKECDPKSIMSAAFVAASYDLPIDPNLGFSAIVPYNNKKWNPDTRRYEKHMEAQFQMMYKGFIQLAIRSGHYDKMNYAIVYEDELLRCNPITGEIAFVEDFSKCTQRKNGENDKIVGYYAWFRLKTGFSHELYMSKEDVDNHAKTYSQSYRADVSKGTSNSRWSTNFDSMALKTVIKLLLSRWGILSIDMERAIQDDQKVYSGDGNEGYDDNQPDIVEAEDPFLIEEKDDVVSDDRDSVNESSHEHNGTEEVVE